MFGYYWDAHHWHMEYNLIHPWINSQQPNPNKYVHTSVNLRKRICSLYSPIAMSLPAPPVPFHSNPLNSCKYNCMPISVCTAGISAAQTKHVSLVISKMLIYSGLRFEFQKNHHLWSMLLFKMNNKIARNPKYSVSSVEILMPNSNIKDKPNYRIRSHSKNWKDLDNLLGKTFFTNFPI